MTALVSILAVVFRSVHLLCYFCDWHTWDSKDTLLTKTFDPWINSSNALLKQLGK